MSAKVPPDGGWGWMVAMASALNGLSTIPIVQSFGLVFKDSFVALNLTATDTSVVINVNLAFGMVLGLINGPLLKTFGYRKIAIAGSVIYTLGIMLTAFANSFALIIICYGILASIGMAMSMSAFSLALNSYFNKRRDRAVALTMTIVGIGPILVPQIASLALSSYGIQGTVLLLGAYSLHSIIGSLLLQPIKWHMKNVPICNDRSSEVVNPAVSMNKEETPNHNAEEKINIHSSRMTINSCQRTRKMTTSSIEHDIDLASIYGFDSLPSRKTSMDVGINTYNAKDAEIIKINLCSQHLKEQNLAKSTDSINLGSSLKIFEELVPTTNKKFIFINNNGTSENIMEHDVLLEKEVDNDATKNNCDKNNKEYKSESVFWRIARQISDLCDFDLLRDPIYVNIMLGMSIAIFAEANFSMLTPFILADMNMETAEIASIMSVIAITDLFSRCAAPFLAKWLRQPPRMMYLLSLSLLIVSRALLIFTNSFKSVLAVAAGLGIAKGIRSVYMVLVVPSYVSIQKLPNASGIQMLTNGIILMCAGPIFGLIRDNTGNYVPCIVLINCVTALTILIWTTEMIITRRRSVERNSRLPIKVPT